VFSADEEAALARVLRSGWIMQGPEVEAFEAELATFCDARYVCAVSSGTAALHLALLAVGVAPGDEVVTVSHSFIATANAIRLCGATPVFVDIERDTLDLDATRVDAAIGPRTRAVLVVHQLGMPADLLALVALCTRRGIALVEDAACALGSEIEIASAWERIGRPRGAAATFSFHPRKLVTTGDGGAVTTRDAAIDARVRRLRQHGADPRGVFLESAPNYRLTDLQAAVGRVQLGRLPAQLTERRAQVERYRGALASLPIDFPVEPTGRLCNWQSLCVRLRAGTDAQGVVDALANEGIHARRGVQNAHEQPAYADPASHRVSGTLEESERAAREGLCLPLYPGLAEDDIKRVQSALSAILSTAKLR
jgi:dTDP-4-amino-4,6-dideoxygalactose transaminase